MGRYSLGHADVQFDKIADSLGYKRIVRYGFGDEFVVYQLPDHGQEVTGVTKFIEIRVRYTKSGSVKTANFLHNMNNVGHVDLLDKGKRSTVQKWLFQGWRYHTTGRWTEKLV